MQNLSLCSKKCRLSKLGGQEKGGDKKEKHHARRNRLEAEREYEADQKRPALALLEEEERQWREIVGIPKQRVRLADDT